MENGETNSAPTRSTVLLKPVDVPKASDVLARELRERILSGELVEGTALPAERELVKQALRVLHNADDLALDTTDAPAAADREVEVRSEAARDGDLVSAGRVAPRDE